MGSKVRRRAEKIDRDILKILKMSKMLLSTRDLGLKVGRAWHSIQTHCLKLQLAGKINGYRISNINVLRTGNDVTVTGPVTHTGTTDTGAGGGGEGARTLTVNDDSGQRVAYMVQFDPDKLAETPLTIHPPLLNPDAPLETGESIDVAGEAPLDAALKTFATSILNGDAVLGSLDLGVAVVGVLADCEAKLAS